jgi:hypothetical protein
MVELRRVAFRAPLQNNAVWETIDEVKQLVSGMTWGGKLLMQIEPWYLGPVPTYRVNKHKDRRDISHKKADSRQRSSRYRSFVYVFNVLVNLEFRACTYAVFPQWYIVQPRIEKSI